MLLHRRLRGAPYHSGQPHMTLGHVLGGTPYLQHSGLKVT
jgi:hypothetical protein